MLDLVRKRRFADRTAAGAELGRHVVMSGLTDPVVLGLARGGVVVAAEVARILGADLDVLVVRKIGHPRQPELGLGAIAEGGDPVYDDIGLRAVGLTRDDLTAVVAAESAECERRVAIYRGGKQRLAAAEVAGRTVVVVDDGVATGVTACAALRSLRGRGVGRLVLATPVATRTALAWLKQDADEVVSLLVPPHMEAVSRWYDVFDQTGDDEVVRLLAT